MNDLAMKNQSDLWAVELWTKHGGGAIQKERYRTEQKQKHILRRCEKHKGTKELVFLLEQSASNPL